MYPSAPRALSSVSKTARQMRVIAIPLTRPSLVSASSQGQRLQSLTYYQFQLSSSPSNCTSEGDPARASRSLLGRAFPKEGLGRWGARKAGEVWAGFGRGKEGGWKLWVYRGGEKLVDRMDFEELALKGIEPGEGGGGGEKVCAF